MIVVKLKQAMANYGQRTGERMTYQRLAELTGISRATLESIASRAGYNASLNVVDKICTALECDPAELLEFSVSNAEDAEQ